jgi:hypothetical protein
VGDFDGWEELEPPRIRPVPQERRRLRVALATAGILLAAAALAGLGYVAMTRAALPPTVTPQAVETESPTVTESFTLAATGTAAGVATTEAPETSAPVPTPVFTRAPHVAYRKDGALWLAGERGGSPLRVVTSRSGRFSLSPDAKTLAVVDGTTSVLTLVDVSSSKVTTVGVADIRPPVWSPSSAWLAFVRGTAVSRVARDGSGVRPIGTGDQVAIAPDGESYAVAASGTVTVTPRDGEPGRFVVKGNVSGLALGTGRIFYAISGTSRSTLSVHSAAFDGSGDKRLVGPPADTAAGSYTDLTLAPGGAWFAYAAAGDDMHSRLHAMHVDGTSDVLLSLRRDDYLLRWSGDGRTMLYIDGNDLQGDPTQLMSIHPDGTNRLTVLAGADI